MARYTGDLRGWGPGWPTNQSADMVWTRARASGARWQMHRKLAPLWEFIVNEVERRGYLFDHGPNDVDDDWGFANRPIGGTRRASEHSRGIAGDIDAQNYPLGTRRNPPRWIIDLFEKYGFEWGGDWSRPDPMHFEFAGSVTEAQFLIASLAAGHMSGKPAPLPPTAPTPVTPEQLTRLIAGQILPAVQAMPYLHPRVPAAQAPWVEVLQKALNVVRNAGLIVNGQYDHPTRLHVIAFQEDCRSLGVPMLDEQAECGPYTKWWLAVAVQNVRDGRR